MKSELNYVGELVPNEPSVIFIPGGMATMPAVYEGIGEMIDWNSVIIDWSTSPGPWDVVLLGNRVAEFIREHELKDVIVAGYSAGGVIAMQAVIADEEHRIKGLLLSNTGPCTIGHGDPDLPDRVLEQWFSMELFEPFIERCFAFPIDATLKKRMIEYAEPIDKAVVYQSTKTLREHDLRPQLGKITCPVTIAHGIFDKTRTKEHVKMLEEGIRHARVVYLEGGHTIMIEDRQRWVEELIRLIEQVHNNGG